MRSFIVVVILSVILVYSGGRFSKKIYGVTSILSQNNSILYDCLEKKDEEKSLLSLNAAQEEFEKNKVLLQSTSDHEELLRIELQYAAIHEFIKEKQFGDALAACSEIELLISHLPDNFEIKAENIL